MALDQMMDVHKRVERNPHTATKRQLQQALRYLSYRRAAIILSARRRGVKPRGLARIDERLALYAELLNTAK
jgi:hypothetical protein